VNRLRGVVGRRGPGSPEPARTGTALGRPAGGTASGRPAGGTASGRPGGGTASGRPAAVVVLAAVSLASAVLSLLAARYPLSERSPVRLDLAVGCFALLLATALWVAGARTPPIALHLVLGSAVVLISVTIAESATEYGALATAFAYVWMGLYASYFFSTKQANGYLASIAVGFLAGLYANPLPVHPTTWLLVISTVLGSSALLTHLLGKLRRLADTDQLTGLLNRRGLRAAAEPALSGASRRGWPMTVVGIDLDGFKQVNDSAGHQAGDDLLVELADAWRGRLRRDDLLGRHGGDEFVLVVRGTEQEARTLLARLREAHHASWSAGLAQQRDGSTFDELLQRADRALYAAKQRRGGSSGNDSTPLLAVG
jgi:diguanylate cyclase (GGDEF)-like protein